MTIDGTALQAILDLHADYAACLDDRRYDAWPDFFTEDCRYEVHSRENRELGLPAALIYCDSHGMVRDRVAVLKDTVTHQFLHARHLIANIRVLGARDGAHVTSANYLVLHSTEEGETRVFSTGKYEAVVVIAGAAARFREMIVIADTGAIENMLAVPL